MLKNTAGQFIGSQMITTADGTAFTGAVTVYVTGDNGVQAVGSVGSGVCTHKGNGYHSYAPAQAETNYSHVAFTFIGSGAIPATLQIYPDIADRSSPVKGVALNNVMFYMVDADDHITAETGLSGITEEISKDGLAFAACTNAAVEVSNGYYYINLTATEMDADLITLRFSHPNADEVGYTITTQEI